MVCAFLGICPVSRGRVLRRARVLVALHSGTCTIATPREAGVCAQWIHARVFGCSARPNCIERGQGGLGGQGGQGKFMGPALVRRVQ